MNNKEQALLEKRKNKCIINILNYKDRHVDGFLPIDISDKLRQVILDEINHFCGLAIDMLDEDVILNEAFLEKFDEVHRAIVSKE